MSVIRNNKEVFTTSLPPELLENLRTYCWDNGKKINEILENIIKDYLQSNNIEPIKLNN